MSISEQDEDFIENGLESLCKAIVNPPDKGYSDVRQFIYVHEFQLALDLLAHIQLKSDVPPSLETRNLFETLAVKLGMTDGDMWRGVAKVRKA